MVNCGDDVLPENVSTRKYLAVLIELTVLLLLYLTRKGGG